MTAKDRDRCRRFRAELSGSLDRLRGQVDDGLLVEIDSDRTYLAGMLRMLAGEVEAFDPATRPTAEETRP